MCSLLKGDMMGYMGLHIYGWLWVKYGRGLTQLGDEGLKKREAVAWGCGLWHWETDSSNI